MCWTASREIFWNIREARGIEMKIFGCILAALYAALMLFAIYMEKVHSAEKTKSASSAFIAAGCLLNLGYTVCNVFRNRNFILILILGMICISVGALMNGFRQKKVHVHHHIIRLILETIIAVICWIGG